MALERTFDEYSRESRRFAEYPGAGQGNIIYPLFGLAGEVGEIMEKVKKILRDTPNVMSTNPSGSTTIDTERLREHLGEAGLAKEIGDVLWYLNALACEFGCSSLRTPAILNISKLSERQKAGTIHGSGDNR